MKKLNIDNTPGMACCEAYNKIIIDKLFYWWYQKILIRSECFIDKDNINVKCY